jgi:flavin-dependent dehydrogenase
MPASDAYDVVVVGAGEGGMTAAAVAAATGLRVLLIEKTEFVCGTTSWPGGMVWIPANASIKRPVCPTAVPMPRRIFSPPCPNPTTPPCEKLS